MKVEHLGWFGCLKQDCLLSFEYEPTLNKHMKQCHNSENVKNNIKSETPIVNKSMQYTEDGICAKCGQVFEFKRNDGRQKKNY